MLVVGVAVLIGLAVVKPWESQAPVTETLPQGSPAAQPTPIITILPTPVTVRADPLTTIDWPAMGAALQPHDAWGIRTIVYHADNTVREEWTPVKSSDADVQAAVNNADAYAVLGYDGDVAALGITTPLNDLPLDVRAWRDTQTSPSVAVGWRDLTLTGLTPSGDPSSRLLRLPDAWSSGNGWPPGEYELDVLLENGVLHIHLWLDGQAGPIPPLAKPRTPDTDAQLRTLAGSPGGFIASGTDAVSYLFVGLPPNDESHDERDAWLALTSDQVFSVPGVFERQSPVLGTANLLGAAVDPGQVLLSARLTEISPITRDLGKGAILPGAPGPAAGPGALAIFRPADPAVGFPDAIYRIDATVHTDHGNVGISWDLPVLDRPTSTESPLLQADRDWSSVPTDHWAMLAPGYESVSVSPFVPRTLVPPDPGDQCVGGANLGRRPPYVGVAHPGPAFNTVFVLTLGGPTSGESIPVQTSQVVDGLVALRPIGGTWSPGRYAIFLESSGEMEAVSFCAT